MIVTQLAFSFALAFALASFSVLAFSFAFSGIEGINVKGIDLHRLWLLAAADRRF